LAHYLGDEKETICIHSKELLKSKHFDYMVYGHRHLVVQRVIGIDTQMVILGDWLQNFSYGVFDGEKFSMITGVDRNL